MNTSAFDEVFLENLAANFTVLQASYGELSTAVDTSWVLICAFLVFTMQIGFALVEAGSIAFNLRSILMKNVMDSCFCAIGWWFTGHGFARGRYYTMYAAADIPFHISSPPLGWIWDLCFACTAATIVSGAIAERTKFLCYALFTLWMGGVIYPFVVHWEWSNQGFLSQFNPDAPLPILDFAGCGAVHMVGGFSGIVGSWLVGPRPGAFIQQANMYTKREQFIYERLKGTQLLWQSIGCFTLWIGWYGFNCGSLGGIVGMADSVVLVAINTTLSAFVGGITACIICYLRSGIFLIEPALMGILAGLVSITSCAPWVQTPVVPAIGAIGYLVYYLSVPLLPRLGIDDPVGAFPIHGVCGMWGLLAAGLFQNSALSKVPRSWGLQVSHQLVGIAVIGTWTTLQAFLAFYATKVVLRGIRVVHAEDEYKMVEEEYPRVGPTGRVTLVFTDIQSSTSLWEANEESMSECIILHDYILRSCLKDNHGFEVKTEGDAFMCAFPSCVDATKYCIAVQRRLLDAKWPKEIYTNYAARVQDDGEGHIMWKGLRVRMGLHSGQPSSKENPVTTRTDYFGKDVNYAARVSAAGCGGQILISASSMEDLFQYCSDAFEFDKEAPFGMPEMQPIEFGDLECWVQYIGQHGLKGISEAEHLFQVTPFGLEAGSPLCSPTWHPRTAASPPVLAELAALNFLGLQRCAPVTLSDSSGDPRGARQFLNPKLEEPSIPSRPRTHSRGSVRSQAAILVTEATAPPAPRSFESLQMEEVELDSRLFSHVVDPPHTLPKGPGR
jgi:Amt family ammonium transporter